MVDSLKIFEVLKVHLPEPEARAVTQAIQQTETEIGQDLRSAMQATFAQCATKADLMTGLADLRAEMMTKIAEMESRLIRWMFVFWISQVGATLALLKFAR